MVYTFFMFLIWNIFGNFGKTAVFPGGYSRIGDIPCTWADMAGLGSIGHGV